MFKLSFGGSTRWALLSYDTPKVYSAPRVGSIVEDRSVKHQQPEKDC